VKLVTFVRDGASAPRLGALVDGGIADLGAAALPRDMVAVAAGARSRGGRDP
jgi:hypothetical protein